MYHDVPEGYIWTEAKNTANGETILMLIEEATKSTCAVLERKHNEAGDSFRWFVTQELLNLNNTTKEYINFSVRALNALGVRFNDA